MSQKIKILFSDIGGVLLTNGWPHESRMAAAKTFNIDYEEMNILHNFIFNVYEIGRITLDDYLNTAVFNKKRDFTKKEFIDFMYAQSQLLPNMLSWLIDWKRNHEHVKVISMNNEPRELNQYRIKQFRLHDFFDAFVSSCEVGMRKPDPGIYHLGLGIAQANPEECVYLDDRFMLVEAAAKTGIQAFQHTSFENTKKFMESLDW
jgi:putative hydrolase of the HAD superfamily